MPPGWETHPVSLEELTLAYLRQPGAAALPGPARRPDFQPSAGHEMTALTVPARLEQDASLRPLPWRRMAWVIWRQHRIALGGVAAFLGALAIYVWDVGLQLHHAYAAATTCNPNSPACADLITHFNNMNHVLQGGYVLQIVPALIGAFVGAPVLARELETGTFRYAWTQGFERWRWTLAKLVALAVAVTAAAGALSVLLSWYYQPYFATRNQALDLSGLSPFCWRPVRPARRRVRRLDAGRLRHRRSGRHAHPPGRPRHRRHPGRLHRARARGRERPAPALPDAAAHPRPERARFRLDHAPMVGPRPATSRSTPGGTPPSACSRAALPPQRGRLASRRR